MKHMARTLTDRILVGSYKALIAAIFCFVLAPIVLLVPASLNPENALEIPTSFTLRWYIEFFYNKEFASAFFFASLPIALMTSVIALVLGLAAAYGIIRGTFKGKTFLEVFLMLPLVIPSMTIGVTLLLIFTGLQLTNTYWGIIFGHVLISLPFVFRVVYASLEGLDLSIEEAARTLGANSFEVFKDITLPLIMPGLLAGMLFAFSISFTDVNIAIFQVGWRVVTFPVVMFHWINYIRNPPFIAAMATIQVLMIFMIGIIIEKIFGLGKTFQI